MIFYWWGRQRWQVQKRCNKNPSEGEGPGKSTLDPCREERVSRMASALSSLRLHLFHDLIDHKRISNLDCQFAISRAHMHFSIFGNIRQQDAQAQGHRQQAFDHTAQRTRALRLAEAFLAQ